MKDKDHSPTKTSKWYREYLGVDGDTVFPYDTSYFSPANSASALSFQVDHLAPLLASWQTRKFVLKITWKKTNTEFLLGSMILKVNALNFGNHPLTKKI